ncbi:MAG: SufE family protein [Pirellulales bacterium]
MTKPPTITAEELIDEFDFLDDPTDRLQFVIELGREIPELDERYKIEQFRVQGCQSQVWVVPQINEEDPTRLQFAADSDAQIVKGLISMLVMLLSNKTAKEILVYDIKGLFEKLGLQQSLTPSRSNGFYSMVRRIHDLAQATLNQ